MFPSLLYYKNFLLDKGKRKRKMLDIRAVIKDADMVLVGLGEEFDDTGVNKKESCYVKCKNLLGESSLRWLLPVCDNLVREKQVQNSIEEGLKNLLEILSDKNYFVVSTAMNPAVLRVLWKEGRIVSPCGGTEGKQCQDACAEGLQSLSVRDKKNLTEYMERLKELALEGEKQEITLEGEVLMAQMGQPDLGVCPACGKPLVLNNIFTESYDENGYLPQWQLYTKWLQGTLNRKLVILELGVGMMFPSVIRWPFEKVAFFNNKAQLFRVNEKLYQLSEDLKGKGTSIPKNSIDWLCSL